MSDNANELYSPADAEHVAELVRSTWPTQQLVWFALNWADRSTGRVPVYSRVAESYAEARDAFACLEEHERREAAATELVAAGWSYFRINAKCS